MAGTNTYSLKQQKVLLAFLIKIATAYAVTEFKKQRYPSRLQRKSIAESKKFHLSMI
jgi:hypothetical protein